MSVLIKNMKMPSRCYGCTFRGWSNLHQTMVCNCGSHYFEPCFEDYSSEFYKRRADFCPLVEVPVPHSRLLDENDVIDAIHDRLHELQTHKEFQKKHGDIDLLGVMLYIAKVQPVIDAEGVDEGSN